jgi:negative regulator of sigma E activity
MADYRTFRPPIVQVETKILKFFETTRNHYETTTKMSCHKTTSVLYSDKLMTFTILSSPQTKVSYVKSTLINASFEPYV